MSGSVSPRWLRGLVLPLMLIALWQIWANQITQPTHAPMPWRVVLAATGLLASGDLPLAILQSLGRVFAGFACAAALAVPLLPVRGQRTHTNARTRKGPRVAIAGKKKVTK